ncbi:MAG: YeeE/YedE family protein [Rhodospirillales bacterium]|nr:YeeE/YedE family protein [Rhodospirillales bacterium]
MSVPVAMLIGLLMGAVFGFALEKSRVFEPGIILGQMQLRNFQMLKIFLTAVTTGLVLLAVLHGLGITKLHPKATIYSADIVGGLLLGAGIALAGACPGTVMAQIGVGYRDAWFTLLGGIAGAVTFTYAEPVLKPVLLTSTTGKLTLDSVTGAPFWILALAFAALLIAGLVALERWRPWQREIGPDADGLSGAEPEPGAPQPRRWKPAA